MKLKAIIYNLKQQPVITAVSIIGTALAIFLIMVIVMIQQVGVTDIAPEVNRHRTLYAKFLSLSKTDTHTQCSGGFSSGAAYELFDGIEGVEAIGLVCSQDRVEASVADKTPLMSILKTANSDFFKINKYDFVSGHPFTEADIEGNQKVAVICESLARKLFGSSDAADRDVLLNRIPYRIAGVVSDVNPIASVAYSEIFIPIPSAISEAAEIDGGNIMEQYLGDYDVLLLINDSANIPAVKTAVANRYATLNDNLKKYGWSVDYFGTPFTIGETQYEKYSNVAPDIEGERKLKIGLFAILLLVPAINLSSITQNRLRQRVSEIGLKRAFGCTRARIMAEMFAENLLLTVIGAIIGLVLSIIAVWLCADFLLGEKYAYGEVLYNGSASFEPLSMLSWTTFAWAILFCLLLNILSCGIPTFMASRTNPATAINGHIN